MIIRHKCDVNQRQLPRFFKTRKQSQVFVYSSRHNSLSNNLSWVSWLASHHQSFLVLLFVIMTLIFLSRPSSPRWLQEGDVFQFFRWAYPTRKKQNPLSSHSFTAGSLLPFSYWTALRLPQSGSKELTSNPDTILPPIKLTSVTTAPQEGCAS